jgi:hypothetical protein
MYQVEIIHPKTGEVIEIRSFNSRYEAEMYGQQWIKHSRISPETYSEDMIEVDEKNKIVKIRPKN